jgi:uncharacterized protein (TIGR03000 family)
VFRTPPLEPGSAYSYTLTADVMRDGEMKQMSRKVVVRAGEEARVQIGEPTAVVAAR